MPFRPVLRSWLCAAVLASAVPAWAAEGDIWSFLQTDDARLFYGVPDSDAVTLIFICERKPRRLVIASNMIPAKAKAGRPASIALRNGGGSASYAGKFVQQTEGMNFEAVTEARREVFDILRAGASLAIDVAGEHDNAPLKGVKGPLAKMEKACFGK
jgi:hypothetical protein